MPATHMAKAVSHYPVRHQRPSCPRPLPTMTLTMLCLWLRGARSREVLSLAPQCQSLTEMECPAFFIDSMRIEGGSAAFASNAQSRPWPEVLRTQSGVVPPSLQPMYQYMVGRVSATAFDADISSAWPTYVSDCMALFRRLPDQYQNRTFLLRLGDSPDHAGYPVLAKSRVIGDANTTVLPLNYDRHFGEAYQSMLRGEYDHAFHDKIAKVFWRGSTTDAGWDPTKRAPDNQRRQLVETWGRSTDPRVDVGISSFVQELDGDQHPWRLHWRAFYKPFVPVPDQLMYRYLVAVEGNDVSSALKWMLASNSVVLMPKPRRESWILESRLQAWVHYVPLRADFSDLLEKVFFCERNLKACLHISRAATEYVRHFSNRSSVFEEGGHNLKVYLDTVRLDPNLAAERRD